MSALAAPNLKSLYGEDNAFSVLRLHPDHEVGTLNMKGARWAVLLTKMRDGSFEVCESSNPIELVQTVMGRRNEIDIDDTVLGALFAVLFNHYYIRN